MHSNLHSSATLIIVGLVKQY